MARFYGSMDGSAKGIVTRIGNSSSGLSAHIRGWDMGVKVECDVDEDGRDRIIIYRTGGSRNSSRKEVLATVIDPTVPEKPNDRKKVQAHVDALVFPGSIFKGLMKDG